MQSGAVIFCWHMKMCYFKYFMKKLRFPSLNRHFCRFVPNTDGIYDYILGVNQYKIFWILNIRSALINRRLSEPVFFLINIIMRISGPWLCYLILVHYVRPYRSISIVHNHLFCLFFILASVCIRLVTDLTERENKKRNWSIFVYHSKWEYILN